MLFKKKQKEPYCKNCGLYDASSGLCGVIILHEGKRIQIPVDADDKCFFENEFISKDDEAFKPEIKQVRMWVENEKGERIDGNGIVKLEAPEEFFIEQKHDL